MLKTVIHSAIIVIGFMVSPSFASVERFQGRQFIDCCQIGSKEDCRIINQNAENSHCISWEERNYLDSIPAVVTCLGSKLVSACKCSCFAPSVRVFVKDRKTGEESWVALRDLINKAEDFFVKAASINSDVDKTVFRTLAFKVTSCDPKPVLVLELANRSQLKLTAEDPVILPSGDLVQARMLSAGNKLLSQLGEEVEIQSITEELSDEDVMNIWIDSEPNTSHLIVAEGFLVGDAVSQRELVLMDNQ